MRSMSQESKASRKASKKSPSFTSLIIAGAVLGLGWGLFLGEYGAWVKWIGDTYVGLLQMTVLPYVAVSLICNIGRLSMGQSGRLARVALSHAAGPLADRFDHAGMHTVLFSALGWRFVL